MFRPLALFVGLRYTRAKRRNHFISFISFSSTAGIALGVAALITVLSVMNGFEKEVRERILDMVSHLTVSNYQRDLRDWPQVLDKLNRHPNVLGAAPYVEGDGMLIHGTRVNGVFDSDPEKNPDAFHFPEITYLDVLKRDLRVMDMTAITLCRENKLPIIVFNINTRGNLRRLLIGEDVGTLVSDSISSTPTNSE